MIAEIVLSAALLQWKGEIEAKAEAPVTIAEALYDTDSTRFEIRPGGPEIERFNAQLSDAAFVREFRLMYAVMLHIRDAQGSAHLILLNGARRPEWQGYQDALVAHELGHAWVKAEGYPTPVFIPNKWACVGVHTGDITSHVLIRRQMDARSIDHKSFWRKTLDETILRLESDPAPPEDDRCARVQMTSTLVDARLGGMATPRLEAAIKRRMPEVLLTAGRIEEYMRQHDVSSKDEMREALKWVFARLRELAYQQTEDYRVENKPLTGNSLEPREGDMLR